MRKDVERVQNKTNSPIKATKFTSVKDIESNEEEVTNDLLKDKY